MASNQAVPEPTQDQNLDQLGNSLPPGLPSQQKKDVKDMKHEELLELIKRNELLLCRRALLERLPDKGKKLQEALVKARKELDVRAKREQNAKLLESSNLVQEFEWKLHLDTHSTNANTASASGGPSTSAMATANNNVNGANSNSASTNPFTTGIIPAVGSQNPIQELSPSGCKVNPRPHHSVPFLKRTTQNMAEPNPGQVKLLTLEESVTLQQRGKEGGSALATVTTTQGTFVERISVVLPPSSTGLPSCRASQVPLATLPQKPAKFFPYRESQPGDTSSDDTEEDSDDLLERISEESEAD